MRPGDIVTHAFTASGTGIRGGDGRIMPEAHRAARARRPVRHRPWLRQLLLGGRRPGARRGPPARRDQHRPPSLFDRTTRWSTCRRRCRASSRSGMSLEAVVTATTAGPADDPRPAGAGTLRVGGPADVTVLRVMDEPRSTCPMPRACAGPSSPMLRAGLDDGRRRAARAADADRPAPVPRRRPRGGLLRPDLTARRAGISRSGQVPQAEPVELGPAAASG